MLESLEILPETAGHVVPLGDVPALVYVLAVVEILAEGLVLSALFSEFASYLFEELRVGWFRSLGHGMIGNRDVLRVDQPSFSRIHTARQGLFRSLLAGLLALAMSL
jgi:hypothetical protein